jgi:predicted kinase
VCGTPGAGKTTYAKQIAADTGAMLLDIDTVTERLVRVALAEAGHSPDDRDSDYFKDTYREPIYEVLFDIARENLPYTDVIIVGPFTREIQDPDWPAVLSDSFGSPVEVHYVSCRPHIRKQRLEHRGDERDLAKLKNWEEYIRYYGEELPPVFNYVQVDGECSSG